MSLFAPRPPIEDRASVILPTVTCSSCAAPIPLSSLGTPAGPTIPDESAPTSKIGADQHPANRAKAERPLLQGPGRRLVLVQPSPSFKRPFANSPASSSASPTSLNIPLHNPSPASLQAPSPAFGAPPKTPSPTNPFFPHHSPTPEKAVIVHGLGLGVGKAQGPFPTDAPLPPGVQDPMASAPDMTSGGNAGMAGVGRRAFAAAAWGVRAGVAIAQGPQRSRSPSIPSAPQLPSSAFPVAHPHRGPSPQPGPPAHRGPTPVPTHPSGPSQRGPSPQPPHRVLSPTLSDEGGYFERPPPHSNAYSSSSSPTTREPPILPRAPLANRPRGQTLPSPTDPQPPHPLPIPTIQKQAASPNLYRQNSYDSASASSNITGSPAGESISQLIRARQGSGDQAKPSNKAFFDRYKAMVATSSGSSTPSGTASPMLGFGPGLSRRNSEDKVLSASPEQASVVLPEDDEDDSALPWARSNGLSDSPDVSHVPQMSKPSAPPSQLRRHRPAQSEGSSNSSSASLRRGGASVESEEVVTPSASWEGIAEQGGGKGGINIGMEVRDRLELIEEDEGEERLVFGSSADAKHRHGHGHGLKASASNGTLNSANTQMYDTHSRANTAPERRGSGATSTTTGSRRTKTCVKCNEVVGGQKRFVERDGVVLCEKDWKKLYLPSCRRCSLPIEKSAVSSSDGQLKGKWHRACFTCTKCDKPFEGDSFYVLGGKPWCQYHYHEENGTLCASSSCRKPIEGACVLTPDSQRFHPGHLRCDHTGPAGIQSCREDMDEYYEVGKQRFCERHVGDALKKGGVGGLGIGKAEKRRTRLVDMGAQGGFGFGGASGLR